MYICINVYIYIYIYIYIHIIRPSLILFMEYLCKITTSSYVVCLKTILKNSQTFGRGDPALLKKLKKKYVLKAWACLCLLCLHLATIFVTIQQNAFSNTVLRILKHVCFTEASFEPIKFLTIFH